MTFILLYSAFVGIFLNFNNYCMHMNKVKYQKMYLHVQSVT